MPCVKKLSAHGLGKDLVVEALLDGELFNHSHFEMKLLASFTSRNVKTRRKKTLSLAMQFSQLYLIKK